MSADRVPQSSPIVTTCLPPTADVERLVRADRADVLARSMRGAHPEVAELLQELAERLRDDDTSVDLYRYIYGSGNELTYQRRLDAQDRAVEFAADAVAA